MGNTNDVQHCLVTDNDFIFRSKDYLWLKEGDIHHLLKLTLTMHTERISMILFYFIGVVTFILYSQVLETL